MAASSRPIRANDPMHVEPTKIEEVAEKIRGRGSGGGKCVSVDVVTGPYDLVCLCEGRPQGHLGVRPQMLLRRGRPEDSNLSIT